MKYLFAVLFIVIALTGCRPVIKITPPHQWLREGGYAGLGTIPYPDTALQRVNNFVQPLGFWATYHNQQITFSTRDTLLKIPPEQYKKKLDSIAKLIYPEIFGQRFNPNRMAMLTVQVLVFRVDHSEDGMSMPPDYSIDYWYMPEDILFREFQPY